MGGRLVWGYGIPRLGREGEGRRVGERPSNLHDRVRFPYRPSRLPFEPSNVAPLRPSLFVLYPLYFTVAPALSFLFLSFLRG